VSETFSGIFENPHLHPWLITYLKQLGPFDTKDYKQWTVLNSLLCISKGYSLILKLPFCLKETWSLVLLDSKTLDCISFTPSNGHSFSIDPLLL
jgi:hypothetical protein